MTVRIPAAVRRAIVAHARREQPNECCGLLVGTPTIVQFAVPMVNEAASPTRFRLSDAAHIEWRRLVRSIVPPVSIVGVYHSHPRGPAEPSPTDLAEAMYPEWFYAIVGLAQRPPAFRVFQIRRGRARKVALKV